MAILMKKSTWSNPKVPKSLEKKIGYADSTRASTVCVKPAVNGQKKLHECLTKEGFVCCTAEHSIYTWTDETGTVILAIHMDDMPITTSSPVAIIGAKMSLRKYFE